MIKRRTFLKNGLWLFAPTIVKAQPFSIADVSFQASSAQVVNSTNYLYQQDFESGSEPSGWTHGGTVNYNYTTTPLQGSKSCQISDTGFADYTFGQTYSELFTYFRFRLNANPTGSMLIFGLQLGGSGTYTSCKIHPDLTAFIADGLSGTASTVGTITTGVTMHFWHHYKAGSGNNAIHSIGFSTDGTEPVTGNNFATVTSGQVTASLDTLDFEASAGAEALIFDMVRVAQSDIGSNPT